jgi:hypothetical protein
MVTIREVVDPSQVVTMSNGSTLRFAGKAQEEYFSHPESPHIWMR